MSIEILKETGALLEGHFLLSSGAIPTVMRKMPSCSSTRIKLLKCFRLWRKRSRIWTSTWFADRRWAALS